MSDNLDDIRERQKKLEKQIKFNKLSFVLSGGIIGFAVCFAIHRIIEVYSP